MAVKVSIFCNDWRVSFAWCSVTAAQHFTKIWLDCFAGWNKAFGVLVNKRSRIVPIFLGLNIHGRKTVHYMHRKRVFMESYIPKKMILWHLTLTMMFPPCRTKARRTIQSRHLLYHFHSLMAETHSKKAVRRVSIDYQVLVTMGHWFLRG